MSIEFNCPWCGRRMGSDDANAGKRGRCPRCGNIIEIPKQNEYGEDIRNWNSTFIPENDKPKYKSPRRWRWYDDLKEGCLGPVVWGLLLGPIALICAGVANFYDKVENKAAFWGWVIGGLVFLIFFCVWVGKLSDALKRNDIGKILILIFCPIVGIFIGDSDKKE